MSQNYDELENQIGEAGSTEERKGLGKIQHKEILGQMADLSEEDAASLEAVKARNAARRGALKESFEASISKGWVPVAREELGDRSMFYPSEWEFYVKPAPVSAIKNWTSVDEERADQLNTVMNEIIRTSVKIDTHNPTQGAGWAQINSWDRLWFILKVREVTFAKGDTKIEFEDECPECQNDIVYTLKPDALHFDMPDADIIEKHWVNGVWEIDPAEYDVNHGPITLYPPKLGKDQAIIDWAIARARNKQKVDETFINYLMWMMKSPARDTQILDTQIDKIYKEYKEWDSEFFDFMTDVIRNITVTPQDTLRTICPHCGQEATSTVKFPNGIKALFRTETKAKKFGSK